MIRLDGKTVTGNNRAQYIRWINEHTTLGKQLLGQRNATESIHTLVEDMLAPGQRARSVAVNLTLDLAGFYANRNRKAALAYERRTGRSPITLRDRPPPRVAA